MGPYVQTIHGPQSSIKRLCSLLASLLALAWLRPAAHQSLTSASPTLTHDSPLDLPAHLCTSQPMCEPPHPSIHPHLSPFNAHPPSPLVLCLRHYSPTHSSHLPLVVANPTPPHHRPHGTTHPTTTHTPPPTPPPPTRHHPPHRHTHCTTHPTATHTSPPTLHNPHPQFTTHLRELLQLPPL